VKGETWGFLAACEIFTFRVSRFRGPGVNGDVIKFSILKSLVEDVMNKSPFPGMDPYLEGEMWQEFHDRLANQISSQLMPLLQLKYVALLSKRYMVDQPGLGVEIRDVAERRLVTVIEIFSPANKRGSGFQEYVEKRTALLQTETHLLEIDLLRGGERIPLLGGELPPAPYYVFLSRFSRRPRTEVWPIQLRAPLPTVPVPLPVPLLSPDADVPLALQTALDRCFALVGYQRLLDYRQPPPPPAFSQEDLAWIEKVVEGI
jgi:hypothetical protein